GSEQSVWSDHFAREKDRLLLYCDEAKIDNHTYGSATLKFHHNRVEVEGYKFALDKVSEISGVVRELQIPREAMGRGDLKFLAAIGAYFGWRAGLFSLFARSLVFPFGPYLAFGALTWMFFGGALLRWYFTWVNP